MIRAGYWFGSWRDGEEGRIIVEPIWLNELMKSWEFSKGCEDYN